MCGVSISEIGFWRRELEAISFRRFPPRIFTTPGTLRVELGSIPESSLASYWFCIISLLFCFEWNINGTTGRFVDVFPDRNRNETKRPQAGSPFFCVCVTSAPKISYQTRMSFRVKIGGNFCRDLNDFVVWRTKKNNWKCFRVVFKTVEKKLLF